MSELAIGDPVMLVGGSMVAVVRRLRVPCIVTDADGTRTEDLVLIAYNDDDTCTGLAPASDLVRAS
jgi:hypothetical protein